MLVVFFFCKMLWNRSGEGISVSICEWYYCILGFALICFDLKDCHLHHVRAPVTKDLIRVELHSKKLLSFQCRFGFFSGQKQPASVFTGRGRNALNLENMYGALVVILSKGGSFWEKKIIPYSLLILSKWDMCMCFSANSVPNVPKFEYGHSVGTSLIRNFSYAGEQLWAGCKQCFAGTGLGHVYAGMSIRLCVYCPFSSAKLTLQKTQTPKHCRGLGTLPDLLTQSYSSAALISLKWGRLSWSTLISAR